MALSLKYMLIHAYDGSPVDIHGITDGYPWPIHGHPFIIHGSLWTTRFSRCLRGRGTLSFPAPGPSPPTQHDKCHVPDQKMGVPAPIPSQPAPSPLWKPCSAVSKSCCNPYTPETQICQSGAKCQACGGGIACECPEAHVSEQVYCVLIDGRSPSKLVHGCLFVCFCEL